MIKMLRGGQAEELCGLVWRDSRNPQLRPKALHLRHGPSKGRPAPERELLSPARLAPAASWPCSQTGSIRAGTKMSAFHGTLKEYQRDLLFFN